MNRVWRLVVNIGDGARSGAALAAEWVSVIVMFALAVLGALTLLAIVLHGGDPPEAPLPAYGCRVESTYTDGWPSRVLVCIDPTTTTG